MWRVKGAGSRENAGVAYEMCAEEGEVAEGV